jgi:hypothetical protein
MVLLIDEVPQVAETIQYKIPHTHSLVTDHLSLEQCNSIYSLLVPEDMEELEDIAKNKDKDQIYEQLRKLCQVVTAEHRQCFVNTEQYHKLLAGEQSQLSVHSILQPSVVDGFRSGLIAGANFKDTMLYHIWSAEKVEFDERNDLKRKLRFQEHKNGSLITVRYCDERAWSKKRKKSQLVVENQPEAKLVQDMITEVVREHFDGSNFLWQDNKDVRDDAFEGKGTRLPNIPHGLNEYQDIHNIVFLSALLPRGDHFNFLETTYGIGGEQVRRSICYSTAYQSIMRTSIRDPNNKDPKTIIVPDQSLAEYLSSLLPGSVVQKLDAGIPASERKRRGRPRRHRSDTERQKECRRRRKEKLLDDLLKLGVIGSTLNRRLGNSARRPLDLVWISGRGLQPACSLLHPKLPKPATASLMTTMVQSDKS